MSTNACVQVDLVNEKEFGFDFGFGFGGKQSANNEKREEKNE
jgi:hypothetical protein